MGYDDEAEYTDFDDDSGLIDEELYDDEDDDYDDDRYGLFPDPYSYDDGDYISPESHKQTR